MGVEALDFYTQNYPAVGIYSKLSTVLLFIPLSLLDIIFQKFQSIISANLWNLLKSAEFLLTNG